MDENQGQQINPNSQDRVTTPAQPDQSTQPQTIPTPVAPAQPQTQSVQPLAQTPSDPAASTISEVNSPSTGWKFSTGTASSSDQTSQPPQSDSPNSAIPIEVAWSASEYVHHEKDAKWYFAYTGVSILILGVVYLLTRDEISVGILSVLAIGFGVFAARKPETLDYRIDASGVHIGSKLYPITMFKSFAVVEEGSINSIALMPLKRFMPPITMYCAPEDEKKVEQALGAMLPQETKEQDRVDRLMHKVGF